MDDIKGHHHRLFVTPEYQKSSAYKKFWEKLNQGEFIADKFMRLGKDGKEVWIQASYNPIKNDNSDVYKVIKFATDVTEETLRSADAAGQLQAIDQVMATIEFELDGTVITANDAVEAMAKITKSSKKINDIIGVIDEIAFQTNLLALNAAVEAARAGEQGRGFAVVAGEVRTLAQRSASAAKEIKDLIRTSVENVNEGSDLVNQSGSALNEIVVSVQKVGEIISEISAAGQEQAMGIEQINSAVTAMDTAVQQNSALVEETAAASANLNDQAQAMSDQVASFKLG